MPRLTPLKEMVDRQVANKKECEYYAELSIKLYLFLKRAEAEAERKEAEACKPKYMDTKTRYSVQMRGDL